MKRGFVSDPSSWAGQEFFDKEFNVPTVLAVEWNDFVSNEITFLHDCSPSDWMPCD